MKTPMWRRYLLFWGRRIDDDLAKEFQFHLEMKTQELIDRGMDRRQAQAEAHRYFGEIENFRRECRKIDGSMENDIRRRDVFNRIRQDFEYAGRQLRRNPAFTAVAVVILTLGIGANAAVFSVLNAVVLRPLRFAHPERVVSLWETVPERFRVTPANYIDWRQQNDVFDGVAAFASGSEQLTGNGEPEEIRGVNVTEDYFKILGVQPLLGRWIADGDTAADAPKVVVIDEGLWRTRFGSDPSIIGRAIRLTGELRTVVGVMPDGLYPAWPQVPAGLEFTAEFHRYWQPMTMHPDYRSNRRSHVFGVVARLKPGVTLQQAQAQMTTIADGLAKTYPANNKNAGIAVGPISEGLLGQSRNALWILQASAVLLLWIACANVTTLTLSRLSTRRREIAVRIALGAGRLRLVRQFLIEGLVLALLGGAGGLAVAGVGVRLIQRFVPANIPRIDQAGIDGATITVAVILCGLACLLFALFPALLASRPAPGDALKESGRSLSGSGSQRLRKMLVTAQLALSVALMIGSVLLGQTFWKLREVDTGMDPDRLLVAGISLAQARYPRPENIIGFMNAVIERTRGLPGVQAVAAAYDHPLEGTWIDSFRIESQAADANKESASAYFKLISDGYFDASGTPLLEGRTFTRFDRTGAPGVAIVNEALVRKFFPDGNAVGRTLRIATPRAIWGDAMPESFEIVGIVGDTRMAGVSAPPPPVFYVPFAQAPMGSMTLMVRARNNPESLISALRSAVWSIDRDQPVSEIRTMTSVLDAQASRPRFQMLLMIAFGSVALVMAATGVYGLASYFVSQRANEISIRIALGAGRRDVVLLVGAQVLWLAGAGIALGLAAAAAGTRFIEALLFGVQARDPLTFFAVPLFLLVVVLTACYPAARRAARLDPAETLRLGPTT